MAEDDGFFELASNLTSRTNSGWAINFSAHFDDRTLSDSYRAPDDSAFHYLDVFANVNWAGLGIEDCTCYLGTFFDEDIVRCNYSIVGRYWLACPAFCNYLIVVLNSGAEGEEKVPWIQQVDERCLLQFDSCYFIN